MTTIPANNPNQTGYKAHAIQRGETFSVSHSVLTPKKGFNKRRRFKGISELAGSIRENGFRKTNPLIVEWNKELQLFEVIHGERRFRAVKLLVEQGQDPGPVWCMSESRDTTPLQQLYDQLITNTGEHFTPLEKGLLYLEIISQNPGITGVEIGEKVRETKQAVSQAIILASQGSPAIHAAVQEDQISSTTANTIIKQAGEDHTAQDALLAEALAAASQSGSTHATPKHLPKKEKTAPPGKENSDSPAPSSSDDPNVIIPPIEDETTETTEDLGTANPDAPADPGAMERLKNSPSASTGISGGGGGGARGSSDPKTEGRIRKINDLLEELNADNCHTDRWTTIELLLTYLDGKHTIKEIRAHLLGK